MKELSLHILDVAMNSVKAKATLIEITIDESIVNDTLKIIIKDNGTGMSEETLKNVRNPFYTTRTTRKVGLGLPMLEEAAQRCNGYMDIKSKIGEGTIIEVCFERSNIDRAPLGNMGDTMMTLVNSLENCELIYNHIVGENKFEFSTVQIKEILDGADIKSNDVMLWIKDYINENVHELY